jgi:hypothetical protein
MGTGIKKISICFCFTLIFHPYNMHQIALPIVIYPPWTHAILLNLDYSAAWYSSCFTREVTGCCSQRTLTRLRRVTRNQRYREKPPYKRYCIFRQNIPSACIHPLRWVIFVERISSIQVWPKTTRRYLMENTVLRLYVNVTHRVFLDYLDHGDTPWQTAGEVTRTP